MSINSFVLSGFTKLEQLGNQLDLVDYLIIFVLVLLFSSDNYDENDDDDNNNNNNDNDEDDGIPTQVANATDTTVDDGPTNKCYAMMQGELIPMSEKAKNAIGILIEEFMTEKSKARTTTDSETTTDEHHFPEKEEKEKDLWVVITHRYGIPNVYDVVDSQGKADLVEKFNLSLRYCSSNGCHDCHCPYGCHDEYDCQDTTGPGCSDGMVFDKYHHDLTRQTYAIDPALYNKHFNVQSVKKNEFRIPTISFVVKPKHLTIWQIVNDILC